MHGPDAHLFQLLVEAAPDAIARHDLDLRCTYANATFLSALGLTRGAVMGKRPSELPLSFDAAVYEGYLHRTLDTGMPQLFQLDWRGLDGARRWVQVRMLLELDAAGRHQGVLALSQDITAMKALQLKLEKAEHLARMGFWEVDLVFDRVRLSTEACRLMGHEPDWTPTRQQLIDAMPEPGRSHVIEQYAKAWASREPTLAYEYKVVTPEGDHLHLYCNAEFTYGDDGRPLRIFAVSHDITSRVHAQNLLEIRQRESSIMMDNTPDTVARYDRNCRRVYVNAAMVRASGLSREELLGMRPTEHQNGNVQAEPFEKLIWEVLETGEERQYRYRYQPRTRRARTYHVRIVPERDGLGQVVSVLAIGRDVSEFEEAQRKLSDAQHIARIGYWEWDCSNGPEAGVQCVGSEVLGFPGVDWILLKDFHATIPADEREAMLQRYRQAFANQESGFRYEHGLVSLDGSRRETYNWVRLEYDARGRAIHAMGVSQDVTDLKALQRQTHRLEFYDPLTQLPNRALLNERLKQALSEAAQSGESVGVVLLDVDHFQKINDSLGASVGDGLLQAVAARLTLALREYDTVGRLGGDEFALIVPQIKQRSDLDIVAARIKGVFQAPFFLQESEYVVTASAGVAVYPADGTEVAELLAHADAAMYHAKHRGRDNIQFYAKELTASARDRLKIEADLRKALERRELELFYQPKIDLVDGDISGAEALMRWRHPERGLVPPDKFIGIAEDTGMIIEMGEWALQEACTTVTRWNREHVRERDMKMAVNLSPRQFYTGDLVGTVRKVLAATGCQPQWLELEITESLLLNDRVDIRTILEQLHALGVTIAIDDFGTGYSALSYLTRFPVDTIKIDRSFIRELTTDRDSAVLAKAIVTLARSLRMEVVAEGVESELQRDHLGSWGCHLVQGFLYSRPLPLSEFEALLSSWSVPSVSAH